MWLKFGLVAVMIGVLAWGVFCDDGATASDLSTPQPGPTTTLTPDEECAKGNSSCDDCLGIGVKCLWCSSSQQKCRPYPVGDLIPHKSFCDLSDARWGVCWVNYEVLLICMGVILGVLVISCGCCIYCCCCKSSGNSKKYRKEEQQLEREQQDRTRRHEERRAERKTKLDEIRQKYGLVKDNQYERFDDEA